MQRIGKINLPEGKSAAVCLGFDFDSQCIWDGSFNKRSPAYMSRGEFGAEVGAPRILNLLKKYDIKSTWFIPGHTADTFTEVCKRVLDEGHEIGCHGYNHVNPTNQTYEEELKEMELALDALERLGAPKPVSYRSPYWDFSPNTMKILEDSGFKYDSSLMGNDFHPYLVRPVEVNSKSPNKFGKESPVIELPVSWFLDDWPQTEYLTGGQEGQRPANDIYDRWASYYDYACLEKGCYILTMHPQTTGRAHMTLMLERLIQYMAVRGAWFCTCKELGEAIYWDDVICDKKAVS